MTPTILAVTPGDPEGIGAEIVWKTLRAGLPGSGTALLCVGARAPFAKLRAPIIEADLNDLTPPKSQKPYVWLLPAPQKAPVRAFLPGYQAGWSIEAATLLVLGGQAAALVTGPISKVRMQKGGFRYPGHTEFLSHLCGVDEVTMMLANDQLRITLVTTHLALKDVPKKISGARIQRCLLHTADHLRLRLGIKKPRIAVAALNPHAGEGGLFGDEDSRIIEPAVRAFRKTYRHPCEVQGPLPADTLFAKHVMAKGRERFDAVVCMYHDQGLIPVKLLDFPKTVNVTLGLPMIRTSVDHGTGFDIAGKNLADPSSFQAAVRLAMQMRNV